MMTETNRFQVRSVVTVATAVFGLSMLSNGCAQATPEWRVNEMIQEKDETKMISLAHQQGGTIKTEVEFPATEIPFSAVSLLELSNPNLKIVNQNGVFVLEGLTVKIDNWENLAEQEREARFDYLASVDSRR